MRPDEDRSFSGPRCVDPENAIQVRAIADRFSVSPEDVIHAVGLVGPNETAVELLLSAPPE